MEPPAFLTGIYDTEFGSITLGKIHYFEGGTTEFDLSASMLTNQMRSRRFKKSTSAPLPSLVTFQL